MVKICRGTDKYESGILTEVFDLGMKLGELINDLTLHLWKVITRRQDD